MVTGGGRQGGGGKREERAEGSRSRVVVLGQCRGQWRRRECGGGHGNGVALGRLKAECEEERGRQERVLPRQDVERVSVVAVHRNWITHTQMDDISSGTIIHISITLIIIIIPNNNNNITIINKNDDVECRWAQNGEETEPK